MLGFRTIRGAGWLVLSRFMGRFIDFFTLLFLARTLSTADFGLAALATSLVMIVDTILEIPAAQALLRLPVVNKEHVDTAFTLNMIRCCIIAAVLLLAAWPFSVFNDDRHLALLVAVLAVGPISKGLASPAMIIFARNLGFRQTFISEVSGKLCASGVAAIVLLCNGSYWAIAANFIVAAMASTIASYILAPYRPTLTLSRLDDFSGFIGWFSSAQLVSALNWQFERFLIGINADRATLGRYAVASDISVIPTQSIIGPALQPVTAAFALINTDRLRAQRAFLKAARVAMLICVPASVGVALTADLVTELLLGPKWLDAAPLLSPLALSVAPVAYFQTLYSISVACDRPSIVFRTNAIDLAFRIILLSAGYYLASAIGVAYARVGLSAIMSAVYLHETRKLLDLSLGSQLENLWKIIVAAVCMAIIVMLVRRELAGMELNYVAELAIAVSAGVFAYCGSLFTLGLRVRTSDGRLDIVG